MKKYMEEAVLSESPPGAALAFQSGARKRILP